MDSKTERVVASRLEGKGGMEGTVRARTTEGITTRVGTALLTEQGDGIERECNNLVR
jgi:hypothetical protein